MHKSHSASGAHTFGPRWASLSSCSLGFGDHSLPTIFCHTNPILCYLAQAPNQNTPPCPLPQPFHTNPAPPVGVSGRCLVPSLV